MKKAIFLILILILTACGKKGPLVPPEALVPRPIADLRIEQKGERFLVSWSRPGQEEGGGAVKALASFRLFRREVLPPGEDCEECPGAYRLLSTIDLDFPKNVIVSRNRYLFVDEDVVSGKTYRYKVISAKSDGTLSRASNRAERKRVMPPRPPVVKALSTSTHVELQWQTAETAGNGRIGGYNVYRRLPGEMFQPVPVNRIPVRETLFEDHGLDRGAQYLYAVRTVLLLDGEAVESELSNEVAGTLTMPE